MAYSGRYYHMAFKNADKDYDGVFQPQTVHVRIYDLSLEGDDTQAHEIIELIPSGDPFHTATVDNSEDKFTGIRATQATIKFISTTSINVSTFVDAPIDPSVGVDVGDPRWYVEAYLNDYLDSNFIFKGFLNLDDCFEDFMPEKNEVVLVANDGLGSLKSIPLTNFQGGNPTGYGRVADFLTWALSKTGLSLNLNAIFNIREEDLTSDHFLDVIYLSAKTFEDQIGTCINCFDVIERIIGEEAFLCQRSGQWWLVRVDELGNGVGYYTAVFDEDGVFQSIDSTPVFLMKNIEKDTTGIFFSQEQTQVYPTRPFKQIRENYRFEYPLEIIDNIDFSRGTVNTVLSSDPISVDGTTYYQSKLDIADWRALEVPTGVIGGTASNSTTNTYIRKLYYDTTKTFEAQRCIVIESGATAKGFYIQSNQFPVAKKDKFNISVDVRWTNDGAFPSSGFVRIACMQVRLHGNSGTNYILHGGSSVDNVPRWAVAGGGFSHVENFVIEGNSSEELTQWRTCSFIADPSNKYPCPPIPESGFIEVLLMHTSFSSSTDIHFTNLQFEYIPYVQGGYGKFSSRYYKVSRPENYVNVRDKQVYVSDSQIPLIKGGLFKENSWNTFLSTLTLFEPPSLSGSDNQIHLSIPTGDVRALFPIGQRFRVTGTAHNNTTFTTVSTEFRGGETIVHVAETITIEGGIPTAIFQKQTFTLAGDFYAWNDIHTTSPADEFLHPYAHLQAFDVWNQYRNSLRKFQHTAQGLGWGQLDQSGNFLSYPSLVHMYVLTDTSEHTNDRIFMLTSFDIDWRMCEWKGTLIEAYNSVKGKNYDDDLEIKYLQ